MKVVNTIFQWFFWMVGLAGLALGVGLALTVSITAGVIASMLCFGTLVPLGNFFKNRRELARVNSEVQ